MVRLRARNHGALPRPARIQPRYSEDLKKRVPYQRYTLGKSTKNISVDLDMSLRVVQRVLAIYRVSGLVSVPSVCHLGRKWVMNRDEVKFMLALIERDHDIYLDEIKEQLKVQHGRIVSLTTIWRTLKSLGITSKRLSKAASERNEALRQQFEFEIAGEDPEWLVFGDEFSVDMRTTYRMNGWSYRGTRAHKSANFVRGTRWSVLPGITTNGYIYSHIKKGSFDGDDFLEWLDGILGVMNPYPGPQSVLVLDNCRIHHVEGVAEMCAEKGVKLIYLPPYSPDFNPIEMSFSWIKAFIRRNGEEFRAAAEMGGELDTMSFLYHALDQLTADTARSCFAHSRYV